MSDDDDLFRYLEKDIRGDRAKAIVIELRSIFLKYMTELGPKSGEEKLDALYESQPEIDPAFAVMMAQVYVAADGIMTAVALHLARTEGA